MANVILKIVDYVLKGLETLEKEKLSHTIIKQSLTLIIIFSFFFVTFISLSNNVSAATSVTLSSPAKTETTVTLSWTRSDDWLFSNYQLFYSSTGVNGPFESIWSTTNKDTTTTYIYGLAPNTDYYFYILDTGSGVGSSPSNTLQVTTKPNPDIIVTSHTSTTISLQWYDYNTYSTLVPFDSYVIQIGINSNSSMSTLTSITDVSQNTYTVTGLGPGDYYFSVYDKVGTTGQYTSYSTIVEQTIYTQPAVSISGVPQGTIYQGQQAQLAATATGGTGSYTYEWFVNDVLVSGATLSTYTLNLNEIKSYVVKVIVKDAQDSILIPATATTPSMSVIAPTPAPTTPEPSSVVPEFPSFMMIVLTIVSTLVLVAGLKGKQKIPYISSF